jgi:hypothetical protein
MPKLETVAFHALRSRRASPWFVLLIVASPSSGLADVRPGVEAGLNHSSIRFDDTSFFSSAGVRLGWRTSFTGGATLGIPLGGRFALATGLRYVEQGNRAKVRAGAVVSESRMALSYISVPMLLECRPLSSRRFSISLGPEIGLLVSARSIYKTTGPSGIMTGSNQIKDDLKSTNLSADVGMGFEFPMENRAGVVSLRFSHGLIGVAKKEEWVSDWKTRGVEWLVGMRW